MKKSLAAWSVNRRFRVQIPPMEFLHAPRMTREEFNMDCLEPVSTLLSSHDDDYVRQLAERFKEFDVKAGVMAVDAQGKVGAADDDTRKAAIENHKRMIDICEALGSPGIRANSGKAEEDGEQETIDRVVDSFQQIADYAADKGQDLLIENHGGLSAVPATITQIIESVDRKNFGSLPDFGNFAAEVAYDGIRAMAPYAKACHVKTRAFDEDGNHVGIDIAKCVRILHESGYRGYYGIEFQGPLHDHEGVLRTSEMLDRIAETLESDANGEEA